MTITINQEQRLYVIPDGYGYSCLGFDVCERRTAAIEAWLLSRGVRADLVNHGVTGTALAYETYETLCRLASEQYQLTGVKCPIELTPQLIGLEGNRVEVVDCHGDKRRFYVGRSMGHIPVHLEMKTRRSHDGGAVTGAPFKSVRVVNG